MCQVLHRHASVGTPDPDLPTEVFYAPNGEKFVRITTLDAESKISY